MRRGPALSACSLALLTALAPAASAATRNVRYVDPHGSDRARGTAARPWQTLQRALDAARPGTTIVVRPGRYGGFTLRRSGTPKRPLVIRGLRGAQVTGENGGRAIVELDGVHDVVIEGLTVTGAAHRTNSGIVAWGASHLALRRNRILSNDGFGIQAGDVDHLVVADNTILHNGTGIELDKRASAMIAGNRIGLSDRMITNTRKCCDDRGANALVFYQTTGPIRVTGNRIWGNRAPSYDYGWDGGAFEIFEASGLTIDHNLVWDNENVMETGSRHGAGQCVGNRFVRNVAVGRPRRGRALGLILRCGRGMLIANNTLVDLQHFTFDVDAGSWFAASMNGMRIVNNIISGRAGDAFTGDRGAMRALTIVDNLTWPRPRWQAVPDERRPLHAPPRFVAPGRLDFHLRAGSRARDRGLRVPGVTGDFRGRAPDLGAFEG
jgi:nitrous oxidase accessory protein NosD